MAKLVARLPATAALWVRIQTSLKNEKMGDISKRVANTTLACQNIYKKCPNRSLNVYCFGCFQWIKKSKEILAFQRLLSMHIHF